MIPNSNKRTAFASLFAALAISASAQTGPMVGTVKTNEAYFLYRPGAVEKNLRLSVLNAANQVVATSDGFSDDVNDYVAKFHATGLQPSTSYTYRIDDLSSGSPVQIVGPADGLRFKTFAPVGTKGVVTVAFMSCANSTSEPVWQRMGELAVNQVILGGDTPYNDVVDLPTFRSKHRAFLETSFMRSLIRSTSSVGTWDDHDFGLNNGNGVNAADRRDNALKAFVEYRAHDQFGTGTEGVYHKVNLGMMEIFLLDPRWWSQTMPSPVDPTKKTCYGPEQWTWIQQALEASKAPFKVLTIGEIWQDKKNSENDDQFTYWYERDALLNFIRSKKIPGVVLMGGDIHVSRYLVHRQRLGYDLHDFITSPAHTSTIPSLNVPHPDLEWSDESPQQFVTLTADTRPNPATLTARFYQAAIASPIHEVVMPYDQLTPKQGTDLGKDLRAWWSFDEDLTNKALTGPRFDATAVNGASLITDAGLRGGAVSFSRASQQYLRIARQTLDDTPPLAVRAGRWPLDDNSAAHTVSLWCKPASLPAHGGTDRSFLLESALGGSTDPGYHLSIGFRTAATDPAKINLELYTVTLQPAGAASTAAPTALAQGPFACELDRSVFTNRWAHVAMTFDSTTLRLYVDGSEVAAHVLPTPGPAAEAAGLVIGGHRTGTGRNFDGMIDEVALWSRALTPVDIAALHHSGVPEALPTAVSAADTDGDTLEDWWETMNGLDPENPADALADTDNDTVPAWLEREAGTHPQSDESSLYDYLRNMVSPGATLLPTVFRHPSSGTLGFHLRLQGSGNLLSWTPQTGITGEVLANDLQFSVSTPPPAPWFFRAEAQP